jgi:hypothetical protein
MTGTRDSLVANIMLLKQEQLSTGFCIGIVVISCLKSSVALYYTPMEVSGKKRRGRTAVKGIDRLVAVEYLKADGSLQRRKLYFCTQ